MASDSEACCESDPNFAVICGFLEKFGVTCGLANIDFLDLQYMLENNQEVPQELINLHVKLLRKARKSVSSERWERAVIKFCHGFCSQDAWEIERFGYKKARLSSKLRILKELLEMQFDFNSKFKNEVNKLSAVELRTQPLGKDRLGHVYWYQSDEACQIRVYKEDPDEETWALIVRNRDDLVNLITNLNDGTEAVVNEDSNSLESENKPIIDTGQTDSNLSKQDQLEKEEDSSADSNSESKQQIEEDGSADSNSEIKQQIEEDGSADSNSESKQIEEDSSADSNSESKPMEVDLSQKPVESEEETTEVEATEALDLHVQESHKLPENQPSEVEEKTEVAVALVSPQKSGINIRIKPISELISTSNAGVKEKYIRSEPSSVLGFGHHRKAVDSAGFDVHANYLKRPLSEIEDEEVPAYIKRPRLDRPTLLGNKKKPYSDEEEDEMEEEEDDEEDEVSDEIEEPLMLVKGEGSGHDNKAANFNKISQSESPVSEEIVEEVLYFHGLGNGVDCETGNDNKDAETQPSPLKTNQDERMNQASTSAQGSEISVSKTEFKLGTIIDIRTNQSPSPLTSPIRKSRWDIGKPHEQIETLVSETKQIFECSNIDNDKQSANVTSAFQETSKSNVTELVTKFEQISAKKDIINEKQDNVVEPKRSMFFFGPGSLSAKPPSVAFQIGSFGSVKSIETPKKIDPVLNSELQENMVISTPTEQTENMDVETSAICKVQPSPPIISGDEGAALENPKSGIKVEESKTESTLAPVENLQIVKIVQEPVLNKVKESVEKFPKSLDRTGKPESIECVKLPTEPVSCETEKLNLTETAEKSQNESKLKVDGDINNADNILNVKEDKETSKSKLDVAEKAKPEDIACSHSHKSKQLLVEKEAAKLEEKPEHEVATSLHSHETEQILKDEAKKLAAVKESFCKDEILDAKNFENIATSEEQPQRVASSELSEEVLLVSNVENKLEPPADVLVSDGSEIMEKPVVMELPVNEVQKTENPEIIDSPAEIIKNQTVTKLPVEEAEISKALIVPELPVEKTERTENIKISGLLSIDKAETSEKLEILELPGDKAETTKKSEISVLPADKVDTSEKLEVLELPADNAETTKKSEIAVLPADKVDTSEKLEVLKLPADNAETTEKSEISVLHAVKVDTSEKLEVLELPADKAETTKKSEISVLPAVKVDTSEKLEVLELPADNAETTEKSEISVLPAVKVDTSEKLEVLELPADNAETTEKSEISVLPAVKVDTSEKLEVLELPAVKVDTSEKLEVLELPADKAETIKKSEISVLPAVKVDTCKKLEVFELPEDKAETTEKSEISVLPADKVDTCKKLEVFELPEDKAETTEKSEISVLPSDKVDTSKKLEVFELPDDKAETTKKSEISVLPADKVNTSEKLKVLELPEDKAETTKKSEISVLPADKVDTSEKLEVLELAETTEKSEISLLPADKIDTSEKLEVLDLPEDEAETTNKSEISVLPADKVETTKKLKIPELLIEKFGTIEKSDSTEEPCPNKVDDIKISHNNPLLGLSNVAEVSVQSNKDRDGLLEIVNTIEELPSVSIKSEEKEIIKEIEAEIPKSSENLQILPTTEKEVLKNLIFDEAENEVLVENFDNQRSSNDLSEESNPKPIQDDHEKGNEIVENASEESIIVQAFTDCKPKIRNEFNKEETQKTDSLSIISDKNKEVINVSITKDVLNVDQIDLNSNPENAQASVSNKIVEEREKTVVTHKTTSSIVPSVTIATIVSEEISTQPTNVGNDINEVALKKDLQLGNNLQHIGSKELDTTVSADRSSPKIVDSREEILRDSSTCIELNPTVQEVKVKILKQEMVKNVSSEEINTPKEVQFSAVEDSSSAALDILKKSPKVCTKEFIPQVEVKPKVVETLKPKTQQEVSKEELEVNCETKVQSVAVSEIQNEVIEKKPKELIPIQANVIEKPTDVNKSEKSEKGFKLHENKLKKSEKPKAGQALAKVLEKISPLKDDELEKVSVNLKNRKNKLKTFEESQVGSSLENPSIKDNKVETDLKKSKIELENFDQFKEGQSLPSIKDDKVQADVRKSGKELENFDQSKEVQSLVKPFFKDAKVEKVQVDLNTSQENLEKSEELQIGQPTEKPSILNDDKVEKLQLDLKKSDKKPENFDRPKVGLSLEKPVDLKTSKNKLEKSEQPRVGQPTEKPSILNDDKVEKLQLGLKKSNKKPENFDQPKVGQSLEKPSSTKVAKVDLNKSKNKFENIDEAQLGQSSEKLSFKDEKVQDYLKTSKNKLEKFEQLQVGQSTEKPSFTNEDKVEKVQADLKSNKKPENFDQPQVVQSLEKPSFTKDVKVHLKRSKKILVNCDDPQKGQSSKKPLFTKDDKVDKVQIRLKKGVTKLENLDAPQVGQSSEKSSFTKDDKIEKVPVNLKKNENKLEKIEQSQVEKFSKKKLEKVSIALEDSVEMIASKFKENEGSLKKLEGLQAGQLMEKSLEKIFPTTRAKKRKSPIRSDAKIDSSSETGSKSLTKGKKTSKSEQSVQETVENIVDLPPKLIKETKEIVVKVISLENSKVFLNREEKYPKKTEELNVKLSDDSTNSPKKLRRSGAAKTQGPSSVASIQKPVAVSDIAKELPKKDDRINKSLRASKTTDSEIRRKSIENSETKIEENSPEVLVTRRSTRKTRSSAFDKVTVENKKEGGKTEDGKSTNKKAKKSIEKDSLKQSPKVESEPEEVVAPNKGVSKKGKKSIEKDVEKQFPKATSSEETIQLEEVNQHNKISNKKGKKSIEKELPKQSTKVESEISKATPSEETNQLEEVSEPNKNGNKRAKKSLEKDLPKQSKIESELCKPASSEETVQPEAVREPNKNVNKKVKKSIEKDSQKQTPKVESELLKTSSPEETKQPEEVSEPPTRALRSRRSFPPTLKKAKATPKAVNTVKKTAKEENKSKSGDKSKIEDKNIFSSTRSHSLRGGQNKPSAVVDLTELEKQITKPEVRPTKKFKMSESAENSFEETKVNEEEVVDSTPSPPRTRKTSSRLRRSVNQAKQDEKVKEVPKTKVILEKPKIVKDEEEVVKEKPVELKKVEKKIVEESKKEVAAPVPVVEPLCVKKKVPLLTVVDVDLIKHSEPEQTETPKEPIIESIDSSDSDDGHDFGNDNIGGCDDDDDSDSVILVPEKDPLAIPEPEVTATEPEVAAAQPKDAAAEPEVTATEPEVTVAEPEVTVAEPEVTAAEPEVTAAEPEIIAAKPEVKAAEPKSTTAESEVVAVEPEAIATEPAALAEGPDVTPVEPEIKAVEPEVAAADSPMTLATFKLDTEDSLASSAARPTRKRAAQQSVDALRENQRKSKRPQLEKTEDDSKRPKLKPKRSVDVNLRRSIEQQKLKEISSSEEDNTKSKITEDVAGISKRRESTLSSKAADSPVESDTETPKVETTPSADKKAKKTKRILLGLEISPEIESLMKDDTPVRQSRRIAQIKIKEEAERRKLEEVTLNELKEEQRKRKVNKKDIDKDYKLEKRKRNKTSPTEDETTNDALESDEKKKRKRKRKHWNPHKQFDVFKAWNSSSGSSSSEVEDEEEEIEDDDDHHDQIFKSDHEFSPESDLEEGAEVQPLKRARTARKESDAEEEEVDDCSCQKCGQKDHPEWILLCDSCDSGWHCSCLRPALLVIPEGDWFCPPCQHITLVKKLEMRLDEYDKKMNKREMEIRRKERLAYVGISLDNVLPSKETDEHHHHHRHKPKHHEQVELKSGPDNDSEDSDSDESDSGSGSSSNTESDSDEPVYQLRERRQAHSYRFNDYDDLINSAIQEELDAVKGAGNQGRGKDIATIVNATQEEAAEVVLPVVRETGEVSQDPSAVNPESVSELPAVPKELGPVEPEPLPPVVPLNTDINSPEPDSDEEIIRPVKKQMFGKKKHRKLNSLDVSSEDDAEDEDFKGSSSSESEQEDEEEYSVSESSDESRRGKRRKGSGPIRRSTRARISRYDKDFINDSDSGEEAPRRKKTRSLWDESESEESDGSWGGRGRRRPKKVSRKKPSVPSSDKPRKSKKKKKRTGDDSDPEVYRKRPNIKFGGLNDEEEVGRRTRGKKINYLEALGTDSEDEIRRKPPRIEESEEEYIVQEDEEFKRKIENEKDSDESGPDAVLQDLAQMPHAKPKSRGRGKCGLKIPRKPKPASEMPPDMFSSAPAFHHSTDAFPPTSADVFQSASFPPGPSNMFPSVPPEVYHNAPTVFPPLNQQGPLLEAGNSMPPAYLLNQQPLLGSQIIQNQDLHDLEDEPNPIEQINKNVEQMNEQEMEKMMEEEDYANKQLQLVALQLEKEKKRKEKEALRLESVIQAEQKLPKKRGRKPKSLSLSGSGSELVSPYSDSLPLNSILTNNAELSEPPGISLPMFSEIVPALNVDGTPRKRRGRGKGKKTLAAEAAALAAAGGKEGPELESLDCPSSSNSNTVSPAPDSPMHGSKLGIAAPPQPFSQSQPAPSVITRMLQSQPQPGAFSSKFFSAAAGDPAASGAYHPGVNGPRGPIPPGAYQQPPPGLPHYSVVRGAPPPHGIPGAPPPGLPPMYHAHRPLDPSPSSGVAITVSTTSRDRHSPSVVSPSSSSPLSKGDPTPPPPPYTRPQVGHFPPVSGGNTSIPIVGTRHVSMIPPHLQHRSSSGNLSSPYHPGVPPNYHYGNYPPPSTHPPIGGEDSQPPTGGYPSAPYPENFAGDNGVSVQPSENSSGKSFEDDMGGEFVGLVSYFSSQREDDLDT